MKEVKRTTAAIVLVFLVFIVISSASAFKQDEADNGFFHLPGVTSLIGRNICGNYRNTASNSRLEELIIQNVDPADYSVWYNNLKVDYIYDENGMWEGWTYSRPTANGLLNEWDSPFRKASLTWLDDDLLSTLTYSNFDAEHAQEWVDESMMTNFYDAEGCIEKIVWEGYDAQSDSWQELGYMEMLYGDDGKLDRFLRNEINQQNPDEYSFQHKITMSYDDQGRLAAAIGERKIDDGWANWHKETISYHHSDESSYTDLQNLLNNFILFSDNEARWALGNGLANLGTGNVEIEKEYSWYDDDWLLRNRYVHSYDEGDIEQVRLQEYYPPREVLEEFWINLERSSVDYDDQGNLHKLTDQDFEPVKAIKAIRKAYHDYREEYGTYDGYTITQAVKDANLSEALLSYWTFEIVGNPPTQYIATSTVANPIGEGDQLVYDVTNNRFSGIGITYFPNDQTEIEELWVNSHRLLFTYQGETSVEDSFLTPQSLTLSNHPNPFNPETTITFVLPADVDNLELKMYNVRGQHIRTLIDGVPQYGGKSQIVWDGKDNRGRELGSGLYFYRLTTDKHDITEKMLLVK